MTDEKAVPNQVTYQGELVDGQLILTSIKYPSEFVGEDGKVVMTCEPVEVLSQYPMATSPFCDEEPRQFVVRDQTVTHTTVGGKGVVGRIK
jgi:hypothetical protein